MFNENLLTKLSDDHIKFLHSPQWALIKGRLLEYRSRQCDFITNLLRVHDGDKACGIQREIDGIDMAIKLTERLDRDIKEKTFDVDVALHVIENK